MRPTRYPHRLSRLDAMPPVPVPPEVDAFLAQLFRLDDPERPVAAIEPLGAFDLRQRGREHPHRPAVELEQRAARSAERDRVAPGPREAVHLGRRTREVEPRVLLAEERLV